MPCCRQGTGILKREVCVRSIKYGCHSKSSITCYAYNRPFFFPRAAAFNSIGTAPWVTVFFKLAAMVEAAMTGTRDMLFAVRASSALCLLAGSSKRGHRSCGTCRRGSRFSLGLLVFSVRFLHYFTKLWNTSALKKQNTFFFFFLSRS